MGMQLLTPLPCASVSLEDGFWHERCETNRKVTLPLEYEMNRKTGALKAYQWEWDPAKPARPWRIWVGDVSKCIEAASYVLANRHDAKLAKLAHNAVHHVLKGQKDDGYLYANPIAPDRRWTNLRELHELYDVGHAIEAAVAYYQATGQRRFLEAMCRCADLLDKNFGPQKGKRHGYPGHEEIELALVKLYRATGRQRYLDLAKFFVDERGRRPSYFGWERKQLQGRDALLPPGLGSERYFQAHQPVRQQTEAVGHAVRALYLYCGMADVAVETGDRELLASCRRLWRSVTRRRMYVTGGVGSTARGEAFTFDHDLPNETAYAETCASIALVFFAHRMLQVEANAEYADVMERALYNGVLGGISLDGRKFFYANPLTVFPQESEGAGGHVTATRQAWFSCACCPPNIARLIAGLGRYIYSTARAGLYVHLYAASRTELRLGREKVVVRQQTGYPWKETVTISVDPTAPLRFTLALRIPGWCRGAKLKLNGKAIRPAPTAKKGYAHLRRLWSAGDRVELSLPMPVERVEANPAVRMDAGKVALQRGPLVYCLEEVDNGQDLADIRLPRRARLVAEYRPRLLGGTVVIRARGKRRSQAGWRATLYRSARPSARSVDLLAVPFYLRVNRKPGEMLVWIREDC